MAKVKVSHAKLIGATRKTRSMTVVNPFMFDDFCANVDLSSKNSVFNQFYAWLESEVGLVDSASMHRRCRVSPKVNDKLRALEMKRIRKVHKVKKKEERPALFWSDFGSGPCVVSGFEIYVDEDTSYAPEWSE